MIYKAFINGSWEAQAVTQDQERTVNWYLERTESPGGTSQSSLYPVPGTVEIQTGVISPGAGRAHFVADGREFAVIGTKVYEVSQFGARTLRGTVSIGADPATFAYNGAGGDQLFITSGGNGYILNITTNVFSQVTALNGKASMGGHLDGYFLALDADTSTLYISNLLNGLTWTTGTDFAQRSKQPDPWISMKVYGNYIWLFGELTSELWYDTGANFPFAPYPSGQIPYGIAAPYSATVVGTGIAWLGTSAAGGLYVLYASGFIPEVVSSVPLQYTFSQYTVVSDAVADSYTDMGHTFYVLNFPAENRTWAWDATTGLWAERGEWDGDISEFSVWAPRWHAWAYNQHRWLDYSNTAIYRTTSAESGDRAHVVTDEPTEGTRRLRRAPCILNEMDRIYFSSFQLDMEPGLGITVGQGSDPQVMLRYSNDGGKTWSSEQWRSAGKIGEYGKRVIWNRLGQARRRVFEISTSDPIPYRLTACYLTFSQQPRAQQQAEAR